MGLGLDILGFDVKVHTASPDRLLLGMGCAKFADFTRFALMKYLHTMVRVTDIEQSLRFYRDALGLKELSRKDYPQGRYTLVFLAAPGDEEAQVELTHNWDREEYAGGRNFGHLAYAVEDIYAACKRLMDHGVTINRPPRDGRMAFVRSPENVSIELLQKGAALAPAAPWTAMQNVGKW
jgi:lactoylglutathione lyase